MKLNITNITNICILISLIFTLSCDIPNAQRRANSSRFSQQQYIPNNGSNGVTGLTNPTQNQTQTQTQTQRGPGSVGNLTQNPSITIPPQASSCNWSTGTTPTYTFSSNHIGNYNLCLINNTLYIQLETPTSTYNLCIIPTSDIAGSSFYIGEPRCFATSTANNIYTVSLLVNRPNFTGYTITGSMIMKDKLNFYQSPYNQNYRNPDAYLLCSEALYQRADSSYCQTFKNASHYQYHKF